MDTNDARDMLRVIRDEKSRRAAERRADARRSDEDADIAGETWVGEDVPFLNDLCLMLLVTMWHHVERKLVWLAALVTEDGQDVDDLKTYHVAARNERERWQKNRGTLIEQLNLKSCDEWDGAMRTLRLLANSYKHDPSGTPDKALLDHLVLDTHITYASLPESDAFREGLAASLGLQRDADYSDIANDFLDRIDRLFADIPKKARLARLTATLSLTDFAR